MLPYVLLNEIINFSDANNQVMILRSSKKLMNKIIPEHKWKAEIDKCYKQTQWNVVKCWNCDRRNNNNWLNICFIEGSEFLLMSIVNLLTSLDNFVVWNKDKKTWKERKIDCIEVSISWAGDFATKIENKPISLWQGLKLQPSFSLSIDRNQIALERTVSLVAEGKDEKSICETLCSEAYAIQQCCIILKSMLQIKDVHFQINIEPVNSPEFVSDEGFLISYDWPEADLEFDDERIRLNRLEDDDTYGAAILIPTKIRRL